ncbi:MAG: cytochrome C [Bacteroidetes bacterium]|nr:cytochrome C [Bacteroidota bacterium]
MNYPVWEITSTGGGLLIAIIAIAHVFIAHLAVGGGLFLVLTEMKAFRDNDAQLMDYVKKHTWFFLLLTMVFGGITGVGIWFIISLVNPAATSALIHHFVFGWATEWVFFIGEIVALLIYHYRFGKMDTRAHIRIGWLYFIFAWLSLFIINGIIGFMLTPGKWIATQNFWHGFFNPTFLPALVFRTGIALTIAGLFGLVTAAFIKDRSFQIRLYRYCARWIYLPILIVVASGFYYVYSIPESSFHNIFIANPEAVTYIRLFFWASILVVILGLMFIWQAPSGIQKTGILLIIVFAFTWMWGFEYTREIARKPYVIYDYMYSTSIHPEDIPTLNKKGFLAQARWSEIKEVNKENFLEAGYELFTLQCLACHTIDGYNGITAQTAHLTERGLIAKLTGLGKINDYMPPFAGTELEKEALAAYISRTLHGAEAPKTGYVSVKEEAFEIPPFDSKKDEYVLLVWNDLGMHCISDNDKYFSFLPPANTLWAQLIKRGKNPEIVTGDVILEYNVQEGYQNPQDHVDFWEYADKVYGATLEPGMGLAGKMVHGEMDPTGGNAFVAHLIPVTPYQDNGDYNPYPLFTITAKEKSTGRILASTMAVAPTSTEMGCRNCHQGGWRVNDISGVADETAMNILEVHDRINSTTLLSDALNGQPRLCQSCHQDPAVGTPGREDILNFSAAMHGFHANYLTGLKDDACNLCHPGNIRGNTTCFRGRHKQMGLDCTSCHGTMEDHALALLKKEEQCYKPSAVKLRENLNPRMAESYVSIEPRIPWLQEPDCMNCHKDFNIKQLTERPNAYNDWAAGFKALYRNRTDEQGMMCAACHGSPHAVYFATNKYGIDRDNIQPIMYQGLSGTIGTAGNCAVCHTVEMEYNGHHRNMIRENPLFRKPQIPGILAVKTE